MYITYSYIYIYIRNIYSYSLVHRQCMGVTRSYHAEYQRWTAGCVLAWPESPCMHRSLLQSSSTAASALWTQILLILGALLKLEDRKCKKKAEESAGSELPIAHDALNNQFTQLLLLLLPWSILLGLEDLWALTVIRELWDIKTMKSYQEQTKFSRLQAKFSYGGGFQWDSVRFGTGDIHIYSIEGL